MTKRHSIVDSGDLEQVNRTKIDTAPEYNEAVFEPDDIQIVAAHEGDAQAREARFMEELVVVELEADDDPNSPVFVSFGHNGITQYVQRGIEQTIKRKFLYSALAAKAVKFGCSFGKDNAGNDFNRMTPNAKASYRVRLISDNNPQGGMKWVQKVALMA